MECSNPSLLSFLLSPKAASEHQHRAPTFINEWPQQSQEVKLWVAPGLKSQAIPVDRLLWCILPLIQGLPAEHPACCDVKHLDHLMHAYLIYHLCCLSHLWIPYFELVHRRPSQHLRNVSQPYRWVFSVGLCLSQSAPFKCKQPNLATEQLKKHNLNVHCMTLITGSPCLLIQK